MTGIDPTMMAMCGVFLLVLVVYTITAAGGINKGIKQLGRFNMYLAFFFVAALFVLGPTLFQLDLVVQSTTELVANLPKMIAFLDLGDTTNGWPASWSVFYWCWHMSWAPFVGGFVARISRGRTIREFVLGVIGAPILFTFIWFGVLGGTAIHMQLNGIDIWSAMQTDVSAGIFAVLDQIPMGKILGVVLFINLITFLASSANTAALYSSVILSKGNPNPRTPLVVVMALAIGVTGLILMLSGGLKSLQSSAIASGSVFSIIMVCIIISLIKTLMKDKKTGDI